jgi:hypothetical protein
LGGGNSHGCGAKKATAILGDFAEHFACSSWEMNVRWTVPTVWMRDMFAMRAEALGRILLDESIDQYLGVG